MKRLISLAHVNEIQQTRCVLEYPLPSRTRSFPHPLRGRQWLHHWRFSVAATRLLRLVPRKARSTTVTHRD